MSESSYTSEGYLISLKIAADALANKADTTYIPGMRIARLYTFTKDNELAPDWLKNAYNERFPSFISLNVDPHWISLYGESRFQKLLD